MTVAAKVPISGAGLYPGSPAAALSVLANRWMGGLGCQWPNNLQTLGANINLNYLLWTPLFGAPTVLPTVSIGGSQNAAYFAELALLGAAADFLPDKQQPQAFIPRDFGNYPVMNILDSFGLTPGPGTLRNRLQDFWMGPYSTPTNINTWTKSGNPSPYQGEDKYAPVP